MYRLKMLRVFHNYSREELAEKLEISVYSLRSYEQGKREPNIACMKKISKFFDVTIDYLVGNDE